MNIASIILFAIALYFSACVVITAAVNLVAYSARAVNPIFGRDEEIAVVPLPHVLFTVATWTAFYAVRVYA